MKNILPFMTSVIVTLAATEIPSYISYEVFLAYIGMGLSDMSLGRLIYEADQRLSDREAFVTAEMVRNAYQGMD